ncbi:MAG TPA: presqualene diphosphate synthase HpnD [Methylomirabilota bacterium]|jgi:phytoene synthase|nr:presqualene diphosphate synthase HpnD [Methylomirabilota bacterium]
MNAAELVASLTRRSGSNFYYSFLFLPRHKREAMYALYAYCRTVDDAVDQSAGTPGDQRRTLAEWRTELRRVYGGRPTHPIASRLADVVRAYPIPQEYLDTILDGVEMDIDKRRYATFEELSEYCYRVAAAVGLACIEIFGYTDPRARDYAVNLGVALQLTNIMRDLKTDAERGRIYLPLDELRRYGYSEEELLRGRYTRAYFELMRFQADRTHAYYRAARAALPRVDRRRLIAAEIMGVIYHALLRTIEARRFRVFDRRIRLSAPRKLALALGVYLRAQLPG